MKYLIDTDHISILQKRPAPEYAVLSARMAAHPPSDFAYSIISFHEQVLGAHNYINRARMMADVVRGYKMLADVRIDFMAVTVLPFDVAAAVVFDNLAAQRIRIGTMDLRIASIALSQNLILLTRNSVDFQKVPSLVIADWTV